LDLSSPEIQQYLRDHEDDDEKSLILKHKEILGVPTPIIADQIAGRRKAKEKLPLYYNTDGVIYPPSINLEQASSEQTARFKSQLADEYAEGKTTCVDLTGGLGVDSLFFSNIFENVVYVEPDSELMKLASHNHHVLEGKNIRYENITAEDFLKKTQAVDFVYIDPSRRSADKKVFTLSDSTPNVVDILPEVFEKATQGLIKTSPLLDIQMGISQLKFTEQVYVVAINNEVKELLFLLRKDHQDEASINAINLRSGRTEYFDFKFSEEKSATVEFGPPMTYLFEPNAAIMKAGAFKSIAKTFELKKISASTHFYTSDELRKQFPGRIFKIHSFVKPDPKDLIEFFEDGKANIITRNYPLSVDELRKKTKLAEGSEKYLIGFSGDDSKFLCAAERLQ
jgi:hypothetical protein